MAYHNGQPWNENHLRPDVNDLTAKCESVAEKWAAVAKDMWKCSGHCTGCRSCKE